MAFPDTYKPSIIAFLDVSGLKEAVQQSSEKPEMAKAIENMLSRIQDRCKELNANPRWGPNIPDLKARAFSDSIILTCPVDSNDSIPLDNALRKIAVISSAFQMEVALHGFFIRGAITVGLHYDQGDVCFGPAFVEAYEAERQLAIWPRVILLPKALALKSQDSHPYLIRDNSGITFVNYLLLCTTSVIFQSKDHKNQQAGINPPSWLSLMERHKLALEKAVKSLNMDSPQFLSTLSKYYSLVHYHNQYLRQVKRGDKNINLIKLIELGLSQEKGMTKEQLVKEMSEITKLLSQINKLLDKGIKNSLIKTRTIFAPLHQ